MTTPDHTEHADDQSRADWWTAFVDWLRADPTDSGPRHQHRANIARCPDAQVHRGPDGRLYYGCCVPPGAVRIRDDVHAESRDGDDQPWRRDPAHTAADAADDDGDGW